MKQEDKDLLLRDLAARLPYRVYAELPNHHLVEHIYTIESINMHNGWTEGILHCVGKKQFYSANIEDIKPYLRPMSSMTEVEYKEMQIVLGRGEDAVLMNKTSGLKLWLESVGTDPTIWFDSLVDVQDWLNAHHFDYRGLIPKGLALTATENMYNIK